MSEKLMNLKEVSKYLGVTEERLKQLVNDGEIPAYRLGGAVLRFRKDQIDEIMAKGLPKLNKAADVKPLASSTPNFLENLQDFLYFNDFYIVSAIIIAILLIIIFCY